MNDRAAACQDYAMAVLRRGAGSAADWDRYVAHLRLCDDCYAAWLAARSFDASGGVRPGDEQMVRRAVDRVLGPSGARARIARARGHLLRPAFAAGIAVVLAGAMASAGIFVHQRIEARRRSEAAAAQQIRKPPRHGGEHAARVALGPDQPTQVEVVPVPLPPAPPAVAPAPPAPRPVDPRPVDPRRRPDEPVSLAASAQALFAQATAARQAGRRDEAITLFRHVQRDFPRSAEATISLVSVAQLLSERAQPADALALFNAYLVRAPAGPLAAEALAGKARMLDRLGRDWEASVAREEIRRRFPQSPYAPPP
jgi:TolA-binding protein